MGKISAFMWGLLLTALLGHVVKAKTGEWLGVSNQTRSPLSALLPFDANVALFEEGTDVYNMPLKVSTSANSAQDLAQVESIQKEKSDESIPPLLAAPLLTESILENSAAESSPSSTPLGEPSGQFLRMQIIEHCNGLSGNAHFRAQATFAPNSILGAVKAGDFAQLTGNQVFADGAWWHEAIAPTLYPAMNKKSQNYLAPNQTGWIASCFVH